MWGTGTGTRVAEPGHGRRADAENEGARARRNRASRAGAVARPGGATGKRPTEPAAGHRAVDRQSESRRREPGRRGEDRPAGPGGRTGSRREPVARYRHCGRVHEPGDGSSPAGVGSDRGGAAPALGRVDPRAPAPGARLPENPFVRAGQGDPPGRDEGPLRRPAAVRGAPDHRLRGPWPVRRRLRCGFHRRCTSSRGVRIAVYATPFSTAPGMIRHPQGGDRGVIRKSSTRGTATGTSPQVRGLWNCG